MALVQSQKAINLGFPHTATATGHVANFETNLVAPLVITGVGESATITRCGKNLFDYANADIADYKLKNDSGVEVSDSGASYNRSYIPVSPNTTYTISGFESSRSKRLYWYTAEKEWIGRTSKYDHVTSITFTTPQNCYYIQFQNAHVALANWGNVQVEYGNNQTAYEAYSATTGTGIKSAVGINNVWSDSDDNISVEYWKGGTV